MNNARARCFVATLCLGMLASKAIASDIIEAVWKPQRTLFSFSSNITVYACDELERRLRQVLVVLGAHQNMRIDRQECSPHTGVHVDITFMSPVAATPENVRALSTFDTRQHLAARLSGLDLPTAEDLVRFPAEWREISLSHGRPLFLRAGDCELLEQVRRQLLPRMSAQDVPKRLVCELGSFSGRAPRLVVSALVATSR